jgi:hypothetical protein
MEIKHRECVDTPWDKNHHTKECPVCGEMLPTNAVFCDQCLVCFGANDAEDENE